jgi:hypothetical protein
MGHGFNAAGRMCPPSRSPVTEAHGCFMVWIPRGSYRIQGRGARFARTGGLPSVRCSAATPGHELTASPDDDIRHWNEQSQKCPPKISTAVRMRRSCCWLAGPL